MYRVVYNYNGADIPATAHLGYFPVVTYNAPDNEDAVVQVNSFGQRTASFIGTNNPGTGSAPLATKKGQYLAYFSGKGFVGSPAVLAPGGATLWMQSTDDFTAGVLGMHMGASVVPRGQSHPIDVWYMDESESEFTVPVNAPGYRVNDVPGIDATVVVGTKTLTFTGGILTAVT